MHINLKSITCKCGCIYTCPKSYNEIIKEYDDMRGNREKFYGKINKVKKTDKLTVSLSCPKCNNIGYKSEFKVNN